MNGDEQVRQDEIEQEQRRQLAAAQMKDRMGKEGFARTGAGMVKGGGRALKDLEKRGGILSKGKKVKVPSRAKAYSAATWMILLILAVAKDLLDLGTIELFSVLDWLVDIGLGIIFFVALGRSMKLTTRLMRAVGPTILEVIPGVGFLPIWTLSVLYLYLKSEQGE